jgi:spermidine synthase
MGGTLPVLAKVFLRNQPGRISASLYSINTWGAVFGCFLAGFVLLGVLGETRSLLLASCGNLVAAIWAWRIARNPARTLPATARDVPTAAELRPTSWAMRVVYIASFVNGFAALALEVLWGRTLGLFTDASVYAYTGIIGMFLLGIALGSRLAGPYADRVKSPMLALGGLVTLMGLVLIVALSLFAWCVPHEFLGGGNTGRSFPKVWLPFLTIVTAAIAVAPLTLLSGACFPFLVRLAVTSDGREGRQLGAVYSINTIGGILGAILAGYVLLPMLADLGAFCAISLLYAGSAALCLAVAGRMVPALAVVALVGGLAIAALPFGGSFSRSLVEHYGNIHAHYESSAGTVSAFTQESRPPPFDKRLLVNGTGMTALCTDTKLMAHLPLLLHPEPRNVLVICFGMGTTFRSASRHDAAVTVVELQPKVPALFDFFHEDAGKVLANPKNRVEIGDGRNYLLLSREKFSVITVDPAPPMYSAGTVNLYTREFFELCRSHLDQDGIMSLWIPGGWCMESDFRLILKTFSSVFNDYTLWHGVDGVGWFLIGSQSRIKVRPERLKTLSADEAVRQDISEYIPGLALTPQIVAWMFMSGKDRIDRYASEEQRILTDDRPYTEFPWLTWIGHGSSLKEKWMTLDRSLSRLAEPPPPGLFPAP